MTVAVLASAVLLTAARADDAVADYTIKRAFVDGTYGQVHVRIARPTGEATQTPLVLFHASPFSSDYFLPFIAEMATDRVVVAMDTPGYGDSDRPPAPPSIAEYAASAAKALKALGFDGEDDGVVDVLGYHTGALIAAELALREPALVRRLALLGIPYLVGDERREAYAQYVKPETLAEDGSHLSDKWEFATYAMSVGVSLERAQEHFNDMMQCHPRCWWSYHGVFSYESEDRLAQVRQPVLLISYDGSLSEETKAARGVIKNAEHVHIDGVTRGAFDVAAEEIAQATRAFLDKP